VLRGVLSMPAFRSGLFVTGFARLLYGPSRGTIVAAIVAPLHTLRLRVHRHGTGKRHDRSQDTNASPKAHHWSHTVLPWGSNVSVGRPLGKKKTVPIPSSRCRFMCSPLLSRCFTSFALSSNLVNMSGARSSVVLSVWGDRSQQCTGGF
jgi:hypothetical protein